MCVIFLHVYICYFIFMLYAAVLRLSFCRHSTMYSLCPLLFRGYLYSNFSFGEESKKISNDQELIQSDPFPALKTKREITKYIN